MKKLIIKALLISIALVAIACSEEFNNVKENSDNDTTKVSYRSLIDSTHICDSTEIDTVCTYENICLDTNLYSAIHLQDLIGEWKLQSFVDLSDCSIEHEPSNVPNSVIIMFTDSININGHTVSNIFEGKYRIVNSNIEFYDIITTEINEPEWGKMFSDALYKTNYIFYYDSKVFIFFNNSSNLMVFTKN